MSIVALLTLLGSFGLGFLFLIWIAAGAVGGGEVGGAMSWWSAPGVVVTLFLALYAFLLSIVMFIQVRSRLLWYASVLFWLAIAVFFTLLDSYRNPFAPQYWGIRGWFLFASPFIYSVGCLAYFQTLRVKEYFHIQKAQ